MLIKRLDRLGLVFVHGVYISQYMYYIGPPRFSLFCQKNPVTNTSPLSQPISAEPIDFARGKNLSNDYSVNDRDTYLETVT